MASAVVAAVGTTVAAAQTVSLPITSDVTLQEALVFSGSSNATLISGTSAKSTVLSLNGFDATLLTSRTANSNQGMLYNAAIEGTGKETVSLSSGENAPVLGTGTNRIENLASLSLVATGKDNKAITGYGSQTITNVRNISIVSEDDAIHFMGDATGSVEIKQFDNLLIESTKSGYGLQLDNDDEALVTIEGNAESRVEIKNSTLWKAAVKLQSDEANLSISAGTIDLESGVYYALHATAGTASLHADQATFTGSYGISASGAAQIDLTASDIDVEATSTGVSLSGSSQLTIHGDDIHISGKKTFSALNSWDGKLTIGPATAGVKASLVSDGSVSLLGGEANLTDVRFDLATGASLDIANLTGQNNDIVVNEVSADAPIVEITANGSENLRILASGALNDQYRDANELAQALMRTGTIGGETLDQVDGVDVGAEAGSVSGGFTVDENGNVVADVNPSMAAVAHFSAMTLTQWRGQNNHLTERLGDVRTNDSLIGGWVRAYGYDSDFSDTVDVKTQTRSIQVGSDVRVSPNWIVGSAASYTDLDAEFSNGQGDAEGYDLALYASGFFDCGGFIDAVARVGRLSSEVVADTLSNTGGVLTGDYDNTALGISVETGYRWQFAKSLYAEPQAELAYSIVFGDDFMSKTNGVRIEQDDFESLVGRIGARLGGTFADDRADLYVHASVNYDFLGNADAVATPQTGVSQRIETDLGGAWVSYGLGAQFQLDNGTSFYGTLERSSGSEYDENLRYSVGVRMNF